MQIKSDAVSQMLSCMLLHLARIPCPHCCSPWRAARWTFHVLPTDHNSVGSPLSTLEWALPWPATSQEVPGHAIASSCCADAVRTVPRWRRRCTTSLGPRLPQIAASSAWESTAPSPGGTSSSSWQEQALLILSPRPRLCTAGLWAEG